MGVAPRTARTWRRPSPAAVVLLVLLGALPASATAAPTTPALTPHSIAAADKPCTDGYRQVPGQGVSCQVGDALWKVKLPNGAYSLTHGPDPRAAANPGANGQHGVFSPDVVSRDPECATSNAFQAILAHPSNNPGDETAQEYRDRIRHVNGILYQAAVESGSPNGDHFRFVCNGTGDVDVKEETLNVTQGQASFATIQSALQNRGYNSASLKYVVYWDAPVGGGIAGQGAINPDDSDSASNANNLGSEYAINYNSDDEVLLHEMGHTIGAVQPGAPNATGVNKAAGNGWHCWQDFDVMCYNDGGDTDPGTLLPTCNTGAGSFDHFDCGHDSYFDAQIGAGQGANGGQYLDTHWNIGECYVAFLENGACGAGGPPHNDAFATPAAAANLPYASGVNTANATVQGGEPPPSCAAAGKTVWYRFTPTRDMTLIADTEGDTATPDSTFDTVLAAYTGTTLGGLTEVGCDDDIANKAGNTRSRVQFNATAGTTYYFQVGGFNDAGTVASGQLTFVLQALPQPPPNDAFAAATVVNTLPFADGDLPTGDATTEAGEPLQAPEHCTPVGKTVWYRYTPPADTRLAATTDDGPIPGTDFDTVVAVYRGTSLGGLTRVGCNDDIAHVNGNLRSRVEWEATAGQTYYVQVGGFRQTGEATGETASGELDLSLSAVTFPPPANDALGSAQPISTLSFFSNGVNTRGASSELDEPTPSCAPIGKTVWYRWSPTQSEQVAASTLGSNYNTVLAVYSGTSLSALAEVGCGDDIGPGDSRSRVQFDTLAGETYYFQAGGKGGAGGTLTFGVTRPGEGTTPQPEPDPVEMPPITPDPMPDPLPDPAPKPSSSVALVGRPRIAVTRSGMARVPLRCTVANGAEFCEGRATVLRSGKSIGSEPYDMDAGKRKTVAILLRSAARRTLRRRGTLPAVLRFRTLLDDAVVQSAQRSVTLVAPKRR